MYVCIYIYIHKHYTYVYIYIYMYIHIFIFTYAPCTPTASMMATWQLFTSVFLILLFVICNRSFQICQTLWNPESSAIQNLNTEIGRTSVDGHHDRRHADREVAGADPGLHHREVGLAFVFLLIHVLFLLFVRGPLNRGHQNNPYDYLFISLGPWWWSV